MSGEFVLACAIREFALEGCSIAEIAAFTGHSPSATLRIMTAYGIQITPRDW